jgi:hypothetical protein
VGACEDSKSIKEREKSGRKPETRCKKLKINEVGRQGSKR